MTTNKIYSLLLVYSIVGLSLTGCYAENSTRQDVLLNSNWKTAAHDTNQEAYAGFESIDYNDANWITVDVPHNWDQYHGYRRLRHGNRHGTAWYRRSFTLPAPLDSQRAFLWFEGVGSYATVWVNGRQVGTHAGGRTSFTIDVTDVVTLDHPSTLAVRADHPAQIRDLPWVCGGCCEEVGFSEGSQPMGIFRPVHLIITHEARIEPFGVHIWNDTTITKKLAKLHVNTELKNYGRKVRDITLVHRLLDHDSRLVTEQQQSLVLEPNELIQIKNVNLDVPNPILWSLENPYLYKLQSQIVADGQVLDEVTTPYGIRWISWPLTRKDGTKQFLLNGEPVFINGIGEYEHIFGGSHAFGAEQIRTRVAQTKAAGFNAFRDGHQPHNLRYQNYWDREGLLWWPQMAAHIWFDNPQFRANFKTLLKDWIKERRNSPSIILWSLENESTLPTDFAEECTELIRKLDPTATSQRLVTTCNGGTGTDWNVIQNWSGTYGGDPAKYAEEISEQLLNGEYGAWRSMDLHTEGPFDQRGILSEDRMTQLLQMKVHLAESVREQCCGQFLWILSSHDNPGRVQNGEGYRDIDRVGPVNYKGLLTPWAEPADVFYMYRSHYVSSKQEPMVYIVSHTWPNRWTEPGVKDRVTVYANCDEVELFNDIGHASLGRIKNPGMGKSFTWDKPLIRFNVMQAIGYVKGKAVAHDTIILHHLPKAPHFAALQHKGPSLTGPESGYHYLYRVNCGGADFLDENGNRWQADRRQQSPQTWGSRSWTDQFNNLPAMYASQRRTFDPIDGTRDWKLFQTFRFGRDQLKFHFPVPDGEYRVELYFVEPWYGTGGGLECRGWRLFDVAVNDQVVLTDLDLWHEAGHDHAIKKVVQVHVTGGMLTVHFPRIKSGQAVISAIAVASKNIAITPAPAPAAVIQNLKSTTGTVESWLDLGDTLYHEQDTAIRTLPPILFASDWIKRRSDDNEAISFQLRQACDVFLAVHPQIEDIPANLTGFIKTSLKIETDDKQYPVYTLYSKRIAAGQSITINGLSPAITAFTVPVCNLAAPSDQRPRVFIRTKVATISGSVVKKIVDEREFMQITDAGSATISWPFNVGLASQYGLTFKFNNPHDRHIQARLRIETAGGILMSEQTISFRPTRARWRNVLTSTKTDINAGNYHAILDIENAADLLLQRIEVQ